MPNTRALLQKGGIEFLAHHADVTACAPGRASIVTGLATQNHQIGAGNSNDDYWNYWRGTAGATASVGRTDATAGMMTATVGPVETIAAGREDLSGGIFAWLKRAGITTGLIGKLQNQSHTPDYRSGNDPTLAQAQAEITRTPPNIDFYAGSAGAVSVNASNNSAAFYEKPGDVTASVTWNGDGTCTINTQGPQDSVTLPNTGDVLVVTGTGTAFDQVYDVENIAAYVAHSISNGQGNTKVFLGRPRSTAGLAALGSVAGGVVTCWKFTGGQHAPKHAVVCLCRDTTRAVDVAGTGTLLFYDLDDGTAGGTGADPLHAIKLYETDIFAAAAQEFIASRRESEPWFLYIAPQVPHLGWADFEVDAKYRTVVGAQMTAARLVITANVPTDPSLFDGWQVTQAGDGSALTDGQIGAIIKWTGTYYLGFPVYDMTEPDGVTPVDIGSSTVTADVQLDVVPLAGFANFENVAGTVAPTMGDQAATSVTISAGVATLTVPAHGMPNRRPGYIVGVGHGLDGYHRDCVRVDGNTIQVPTTAPNLSATSVSGQFITYRQLYDWMERQEKMISVDVMVGQIRDFLTRRGWWDQTLVMLTGDNGQQQGEHAVDENNLVWGNTKTMLWQASTRTAMLVRDARRPAGRQIRQITSHMDIPLTVLDYFGLDDAQATATLGFNPHVQRDGISLYRVLDATTKPARAFYLSGYFLQQASSSGIVDSDGFKVMRTSNGSVTRIYDIFSDAAETTDQAAAYGARMSAMVTRMTTLATKRGAAYRST